MRIFNAECRIQNAEFIESEELTLRFMQEKDQQRAGLFKLRSANGELRIVQGCHPKAQYLPI